MIESVTMRLIKILILSLSKKWGFFIDRENKKELLQREAPTKVKKSLSEKNVELIFPRLQLFNVIKR